MSMKNTPYARARRQMRFFVLIWTFITLVMGLATFMAIYFAYPTSTSADDSTSVAQGQTNAGAVVLASATALPVTNTPQPTATKEVSVQAVDVPTNAPLPSETPVPAATSTPLPVDDKRFQVGIQVQESQSFNAEEQNGAFSTVADQLGLRWVKQQIRWETMEPTKGEILWGVPDLIFPAAEKHNIKVMLSIVTAPAWARESGVDTSRHGPPANNQDYVNFVTAILKKYPGRVHAIEVWNEMNLDREWTSTGGLSAVNYTALLRDTYNAVKAIDPGIIVISGALSPTGLDNGVNAIDDFRYAEQLIRAGALDFMDCFGAHHNGINMPPTYDWDDGYNDPNAVFRGPFDNPHHSWSFKSTLAGYAQRITAAGSDKKLCVTEFGWPSSEGIGGFPPGFEFSGDNTLDEQAKFIVDALNQMENAHFVWLAFLWNFNYGPGAGWSKDNDNVPYSIIGPEYHFRPAFDKLREWQEGYVERAGQP